MELKNLAVHHTGGRHADPKWSSQHMKAEDVNRAHKGRPDWIGYRAHKSSLGYYGGYNFFIDKKGKTTQFRALGEETLAQRGFNFNTISICLAGNFGTDQPTSDQIDAFRSLVGALIRGDANVKMAQNTRLNLNKYRIWPHRHFQGTSCYGDLPDNWARDLITERPRPNHSRSRREFERLLRKLLKALADAKRKERLLGSNELECNGLVD